MSKNKNNMNSLVMLASLAMLTALEVVLSRLVPVVSSQQIKVSFAFLPVAIAAYLYGIKGGALVAGVSDVIGALMFPVGEFFPGFTVTAILEGVCFGFFLGKRFDGKMNAFLRSFVPVLITQIVLSLGLNTFWISYMYHSPYLGVLVPRIVQTLVMIAVQSVVIPLFTESFSKIRSIKMLRN